MDCNKLANEADTPRLLIRNYLGFPAVEDGNKFDVETVPFLEASKEVICTIESFGKLFSPVVHDMRNNVQKIKSVYDNDPEKYNYLNDLLVDEKTQNSNYAANALLWLKRALELISVFFYNVINDPEEKNDLREALKDAYTSTLKPYHKWVVQSAFALVYRWVPTREQLFGTCDMYAENISHLQKYQERMHLYIVEVAKLITTNDLDDKTAV